MSGLVALVLAGARPGRRDPVADAEGVAHKALACAGGEPLLARVVAALRGAGVARVLVAADEPQVVALARALGAEVLAPAAGGPSATVLAAAQALGAPLLVTTADHALLEAEWVERFLADAPDASDACALVAPRATVEAAAAGTRRTWLRLADGDWAGCNLFLFRTDQGLQAAAFWRRLEAQRKRPWRMAALIGPGVLVRYALGRLTLAQATERLGRTAGVRAAVVPTPFGLAAVDVDTPDDLRWARTRLEAQRRPGRQVTVADTA